MRLRKLTHTARMLLSISLGLRVRIPYVPHFDHTIYIDIQLNFLQYDLIAVVIVTIYYKKRKENVNAKKKLYD